MSDNQRLFIALPIPAELRIKLFRDTRQLQNAGTNVKWVGEENYHITLKFLGSTNKERILSLVEHTATTLAKHKSSFLEFRGIGAFPALKRPRVIWIGISEGKENITKIAASLEEALEELGFEKENKKFNPHLTLGRVKTPENQEPLLREMEKLTNYYGGRIPVDYIHLMKSDLARSGPTYSVVETFSLEK